MMYPESCLSFERGIKVPLVLKTHSFAPILAMACLCAALIDASGTLSAQTYSASSEERENLSASRAFDGSTSTRWSAAFKEKTGWLQVAFSEDRKFSQVRLLNGIRDEKGAPRDFVILAGSDVEGLKEVCRTTDNTSGDRTVRFKKTTARVWRIQILSLVNTRWSPTLTEVSFGPSGESAAAPPDAVSGTVTVKASPAGLAGKEARNAVDGDSRTYLECSKRKTPTTLTLTAAEPIEASGMSLLVRTEGGFGVPKAFRLEARKGSRWAAVLKVRDNDNPAALFAFRKTRADEWRLVVSEFISPKGALRIHEFALLTEAPTTSSLPAPAKPTARTVNDAIEKGVAFLEGKRRADGNWPTSHTADYPMGVMALVGMALKKSGRQRDDALLLDLVSRMSKMKRKLTYSVALRALFLRSLSTKKYVEVLKEDAAFLIEHQAPDGLWGYPTGRSDLSNAQYALLALAAAEDCGVSVPTKVWTKSLGFMTREAKKTGGFRYNPHGRAASDPPTGSMTAAGIACLKICKDRLKKNRGAQQQAEAGIQKGLEWLGERFQVGLNPNSHQSHYYYLYGVERVGSFLGVKKIGNHAWYDEGAAHLVDFQWSDGSWHRSIEDTCFALLFLNRASLTSR